MVFHRSESVDFCRKAREWISIESRVWISIEARVWISMENQENGFP